MPLHVWYKRAGEERAHRVHVVVFKNATFKGYAVNHHFIKIVAKVGSKRVET